MGTHPVPRGTNAAAPGVAMSAEETLKEVCWFFGRRVKSACWVPGQFGGAFSGRLLGGASCHLSGHLLGGAGCHLYHALASSQTQSFLLGSKSHCWHE